MKNAILVLGAGKIGSLISALLADCGDYRVILADKNIQGADCQRIDPKLPKFKKIVLDVGSEADVVATIKSERITAVVSCLPYFYNEAIAKVAFEQAIHYFDLTEDTKVTSKIAQLAERAKTSFVPQCGLAPGFVSIVTHHLCCQFDEIDVVKMRVGALPIHADNALKYSLTWSTDGLINEYGNPCYCIKDGEIAAVQPLEGYEEIQFDGLLYEAFNTSGGLGSLAKSYQGKVNSMDYKSIRYPGHCEKIKFLMNDLKLNDNCKILKTILENAIAKTYDDVVVIYISVAGQRNQEYIKKQYVNKIYPQLIMDTSWSAIQVTTAMSLCAVLNIMLSYPKKYRGLVLQEHFKLTDFLSNRFGKIYQTNGTNIEVRDVNI